MSDQVNRREFMARTAAASAAALLGSKSAVAKEKKLPKIKIGNVEMSRMILGSNPFFGYAHVSRSERTEMNSYYTKERVMITLDEAASNGITNLWMPADPRMVWLWNEYKKQGGKLPFWMAQPHVRMEHIKENMTVAVNNGARAICIQGVRVDQQAARGRWDLLTEWLEYGKGLGVPVGLASHRPWTHLEAEKRKLPTDFYCQCLYQPEDYTDENRAKAIKTIRQIKKPVIVYKVLAAGRRKPETEFPYLFSRIGSKDGICVGIYSKHDTYQMREDATLVTMLS